jgi:uncharacterized protein (TIGR02145 family)
MRYFLIFIAASFYGKSNSQTSTFTDVRDNKIYKTNVIGTQTWMSENLNVSIFRNGDSIPEAKTSDEWYDAGINGKPAWCYYNNDPKNGEKYGKLYNWYAVNDPRGLAPVGWHLPSDSNWKILSTSLGGDLMAGKKMKNLSDWTNKDIIGINESNFSGIPGGYRYPGGYFYDIGDLGYWWSTSEANSEDAYFRSLSSTSVFNSNYSKKAEGYSVRCFKEVNNGNSDFKNDDIVTNDISILEANKSKSSANLKSVVIGSQTWASENLNVSTFRNGDPIPEVKTRQEWERAGNLKQPAWCYYNDDPKNGEKYGKLYNWYAVNDARGLAPIGWHIPTADEWRKLTDVWDINTTQWEGGKPLRSKEKYVTIVRYIDVGGYYEKVVCSKCSYWTQQQRKNIPCEKCRNTQLVETGKYIPKTKKKVEEKINLGWNGTNESGFSALPSGYRDENGWNYWIGGYTSWWSLEVSSRPEQGFVGRTYVMCLGSYNSWLPERWESGRSVRCVRD